MVDQNAATTIANTNSSPSYVFALWNLVIRPPRSTYNVEQMGPEEFEVRGQRALRKDLRLKTQRGSHIACSHFIPRKRDGTSLGKTPVIIYMHGNSSNRLESGNLIPAVISRRIALFCYDAHGCGLSEGEYVSLGWHERDDLATVIEYLRYVAGNTGAVGVWGRSMGAVTALMHADRDSSISAMCVDSPFANMHDLVMELAQSEHVAIHVPTWLLEMVLSVVRSRVKTLADFDLDDLVPLNHVKRSSVPALFVHGREDNFILPAHSQKLFNDYAGDAEMILISGDHNSERGQDCVERVVNFFCRSFQHNVADPSRQHVVSEGMPNAVRHANEHSALRGSSGANSRLGRSQSDVVSAMSKKVAAEAETAAAAARKSGVAAAEAAAAAVLSAARAETQLARRGSVLAFVAATIAEEKPRAPVAQAPGRLSAVAARRRPLEAIQTNVARNDKNPEKDVDAIQNCTGTIAVENARAPIAQASGRLGNDGARRKPLEEIQTNVARNGNIHRKDMPANKSAESQEPAPGAFVGKENMPFNDNVPQRVEGVGTRAADKPLGRLGSSTRAGRTPAKKPPACKPGSPLAPPTPGSTLRLR